MSRLSAWEDYNEWLKGMYINGPKIVSFTNHFASEPSPYMKQWEAIDRKLKEAFSNKPEQESEYKLITLNPYRTELIICDGYTELPFELTDEEIELTKTVKDARTIKTSTGALLVVFNLKTVGTIAHEAFHITEYLMELKGIPYNDDTSEVWAYMIGYIVDEINGFLNK